jgi:beta-glucosidase
VSGARIAFPPGFTWGAASSAYQVEGSPLADGASPSNWHEFSHRPGRIRDGSTGDVACDHYRRWPADVALMRDLGIRAYRFSVSWPRVVPEPGRPNPAGLAFYDRLVDALLAAGIEPWVTLFHWDTPIWLERRGGFTARESVDQFAFYVETVLRALGNRVRHWITLNEPLNYSALGYVMGVFPPGRHRDLRGNYHVSHHLVLSHGRALEAIRGLAPLAYAGIALSQVWISPRDPGRPGDRAAADFMDGVYNRFFLDAVTRGVYPADVVSRAGRFLPRGFERDIGAPARPTDFIGVNYYTRDVYRRAPLSPYTRARLSVDPAAPRNAVGWEIWPEGMSRCLARLRDEYGNPEVVITENGYPTIEKGGTDPLDDPDRIAYLRNHIAAVGKAIADGCPCTGYFHWSLTDNFEWAYGCAVRFGLVRVDYPTQERQPRASARWYRDLIAANALEAVEPLARTRP